MGEKETLNETNDLNEPEVEGSDVEELEAQLDEIENALDNLESQNDNIHSVLKELLESNREIRKEIASLNDSKDQQNQSTTHSTRTEKNNIQNETNT